MTTPAVTPPATFTFDADFQTLLAAFAVCDDQFNREGEGLIKPDYFENFNEAILVAIVQDHYATYKVTPNIATMKQLLLQAVETKRIPSGGGADVLAQYGILRRKASDPTFGANRRFALDQAVLFAKQQAISDAIYQSVDLVEKHKFADIEQLIKKAMMVGSSDIEARYDFWEKIETRKQHRHDTMAGIIKPTGITTGIPDLDKILYHRGWGRDELTLLMGPAKSGKSMALVTFAASAALAGFNVLAITLEVSELIYAERLDANISDTEMRHLESQMSGVAHRVAAKRAAGAGELIIHGFPSGSLSPADLRRLLYRYAAQGVRFDLIVVDYADLMQPDRITNDPIENSRTLYIHLRGIAQEQNAAMLSATQTNREGFKAAVGKMEHVASDINKARTVDLLISLNQTEEERANNEARLYIAASRNQAGNASLKVRTAFAKGKYIEKLLAIE